MDRRRIAIVGGGMAGLSAAWQLSGRGGDGPEVTVYQRGSRLGGKGASSRGRDGRIEEHGLHVWLGFYDNAFRLLRACYEELDRPATDPGCPIQTWRDAFVPASVVGLGRTGGEDSPLWFARFPENDRLPGGPPGAAELTPASFLERGLALLGRFGASLDEEVGPTPRVALSSSPAHPAVRARGATAGVELLEGARAGLRAINGSTAAARRTGELIELLQTMVRGIAADGLTAHGYHSVDDLDLREWLAGHGASHAAIDSPLVRGFYDLSFAYEDGDPERPRFPAGLALHLALRMFLDYKGALFWKMRAGMGDVVFAPLYQALRRRGVRFRFFHRLDRLQLSDDRRTVQAATFGREEVAGDEYAPLVRIRGLPVFPARSDPLRPDAARVRLEAGRDYDALVLAVSLGMLPHTCAELIESDERWRSMVDRVGTVATQAFQVWMSADERALGWDQPAATVTGCGEPFETFASMSHTLPLEDWPEDERPLTAAYFCGALAESELAGGPAASERVQAAALAFLERRGPALWPAAADANGDFRSELVHSRYLRANVDPSDRYVQSLPGTSHYRLPADGSGFENLFLAGDWIDSGLNAGCIEAAVLGGLQAANAVEGRPLADGTSGGYLPRQAVHSG